MGVRDRNQYEGQVTSKAHSVASLLLGHFGWRRSRTPIISVHQTGDGHTATLT